MWHIAKYLWLPLKDECVQLRAYSCCSHFLCLEPHYFLLSTLALPPAAVYTAKLHKYYEHLCLLPGSNWGHYTYLCPQNAPTGMWVLGIRTMFQSFSMPGLSTMSGSTMQSKWYRCMILHIIGRVTCSVSWVSVQLLKETGISHCMNRWLQYWHNQIKKLRTNIVLLQLKKFPRRSLRRVNTIRLMQGTGVDKHQERPLCGNSCIASTCGAKSQFQNKT